MSGIKNPVITAISSSAFPIQGISQGTKQAMKLFVPSPKYCYSDSARLNRIAQDGNVALFEECNQLLGTNVVLNPTAYAAVAGTPGTQPNAWAVGSYASGITRTIVGSGYELFGGINLPYLEVRFAGTTTSSGSIGIDPTPLAGIAAKSGERWCASVYARLTGGSIASLGFNLILPEVSAAQGILNTNELTSLSDMTSTYTRYVASRVLTDANCTYTAALIRTSTIASGTAVDFTVRIAAPQLEKFVSTPTAFNIRTTALQFTAGFQPKLRKGVKNWILNSSASGFTSGTPGTAPATWNYGSPTGVTRQIVSTGTELVNGISLPYVDVRFASTGSNNSGECFLDPAAPGAIPAALTQTWAFSVYLKLVSGSLPTSYIQLIERDSSNTFLVGTNLSINSMSNNLSKSSPVFRVLNQPTVAKVHPTVRFNVSANSVFDFTVRIAAPQLELGGSTTSNTIAFTNGAYASNGVGQWWLDFDGIQTKMEFSQLLISNSGTQSFSVAGTFSNNYVSGSIYFVLSSSNNTSGARSGLLGFNHGSIEGYKDSVGTSAYTIATTPTAPNQNQVMSTRRNGNAVRNKTNAVATNLTPTFSTFDCTNSYLGANFTTHFLNGGVYGFAFGDGYSPSDSDMLGIEKYFGRLTGVAV